VSSWIRGYRPPHGRILVYDLESGEATHLAPSKGDVVDPKFSPDSASIAFVYEHDIWIVPVSGGEVPDLT